MILGLGGDDVEEDEALLYLGAVYGTYLYEAAMLSI